MLTGWWGGERAGNWWGILGWIRGKGGGLGSRLILPFTRDYPFCTHLLVTPFFVT